MNAAFAVSKQENNRIMEARITYRYEIYIEGKDLNDIRRKWYDIDLTPKFVDVAPEGVEDGGFIELVSAEDADTWQDLKM